MQASQSRCAPCPKSDAPLTLCSFCRETLDFPRSWLLPVLRDYVQGARLGFFTSYFLPLAATLKSRGEEQGGALGTRCWVLCRSSIPQGRATSTVLFISPSSFAALEFAQAGKSLESKIYDTLQWQVTGYPPPPPLPICSASLGVLAEGCWSPTDSFASRSGPCCPASAPVPQTWWRPSRGWHAPWAWPSASARTSAPPCARPYAPSSTTAAGQVGDRRCRGKGGCLCSPQ